VRSLLSLLAARTSSKSAAVRRNGVDGTWILLLAGACRGDTDASFPLIEVSKDTIGLLKT